MKHNLSRFVPCLLAVLLASATAGAAFWQEWKSGIEWPEPAVIDPGGPGQAPSDAIVLFDGKDLSAFKGGDRWEITDEGYAIVRGGSISTNQAFGDM